MGNRERIGVGAGATVLAVAVALLTLSAPASAAPKRITGKLDVRGFTVIALAANGAATTDRAPRGRFSLRPPRRVVTLHLRARDGTYAGPVVAGTFRKGQRAITGVRAGAKLRKVDVRKPRGYSRVTRRLPERLVDAKRRARAKRGAPIGAGNFGRVRSKRTRGGVPGDRDLDGVPNVIDVDDDGDRVLDSQDRSGRRRARAAQGGEQQINFFFSRLTTTLDTAANANATGLTKADMDRALSNGGDLLFGLLPNMGVPGEIGPNSPELDCGGSIQQPPRPDGLIYCRPHTSGGIGSSGPGPDGPPFPDCCDSDGDGFGTITPDAFSIEGGPGGMTLHHGATTDQIGTGDLIVQHVASAGQDTAYLAQLQYVFASAPALVEFDDGQGNQTTVSYPVADNAPGTRENGFPIAAGPKGDVVATVTFWRPQREGLPEWGEPGDWIDIGGLGYEVQVEESGGRCPQNAYTEDDANLEPSSAPADSPGLSDTAPDRPANPANTLTYTLNLTRCLEAHGFSFEPGENRAFSFLAVNPSGVDNAQQSIWFRRG